MFGMQSHFRERQGTRGMPLGFCCFSSLACALIAFPHPSHLFFLLPSPSGNHRTIQRKTNSILPIQIPLKWPCFSSLNIVLQVVLKQSYIGWTLASRSSFSVDQILYQRIRRRIVTREGEIFWTAETTNRLVVITQMKTSLDYFWNSFPNKYWCSVLSLLIFNICFVIY